MKSYTVDVCMEDVATGEMVVECRRGFGCAPATASKLEYHLEDLSAVCASHSVPDFGALPKC
jgi:hypothetical protein